MNKRWLNLQQFAGPLYEIDGGGGSGGGDVGSAPAPTGDVGGSAPAPAQTYPGFGGTQSTVPNPLLMPGAEDTPTPTPQPTTAEEVLDFGGRKIPVVDPALKDLHGDWQELNRSFTQTRQQQQAMEQQMGQMQAMLQYSQQLFQQQQANAQFQQQAPQEPPAPAFDKEQFFEQFYEDPEQAFSQLNQTIQSQFDQKLGQIEQRFNQYVQPMVYERQYTEQLNAMNQKFNDFQEVSGPMSELLQARPDLLQNMDLESIYFLAKGMNAKQAPSPEQLLQSPEFRQQVLSDEAIRSEFLKTYMNQKQQTNQQTPPVMGSGFGGQAPTVPPDSPKTLGEASKLFRQFLGQ